MFDSRVWLANGKAVVAGSKSWLLMRSNRTKLLLDPGHDWHLDNWATGVFAPNAFITLFTYSLSNTYLKEA